MHGVSSDYEDVEFNIESDTDSKAIELDFRLEEKAGCAGKPSLPQEKKKHCMVYERSIFCPKEGILQKKKSTVIMEVFTGPLSKHNKSLAF